MLPYNEGSARDGYVPIGDRRASGWALCPAALLIEPGRPRENGSCESFNGKLSDELLEQEIFYSLRKRQLLIEPWRRTHNTVVRPQPALGYRPPAPEAVRIVFPSWSRPPGSSQRRTPLMPQP